MRTRISCNVDLALSLTRSREALLVMYQVFHRSIKMNPFNRPASSVQPAPGPVQVIAVTGGKGGVGKTSVSVNLATALASTGKRVMLLDGDLGLANVDVFLGLSPRHTMAHVLSGERTLEEIILESPHGVQVVPGASGVAELANLSAAAHLNWCKPSAR